MTPNTAVACLAEIVVAQSEFDEDDLYAAMAQAGIPDPVAERAISFTQIAWGRVFLGRIGVKFSPEYLYFNESGDIVASGLLAEEPYFAAASFLAKRVAHAPGVRRLALMSADAHAVQSALKDGSTPEDLYMGPAGLFVGTTTPQGLKKAHEILSERASALIRRSSHIRQESVPGRKPWWQFW